MERISSDTFSQKEFSAHLFASVCFLFSHMHRENASVPGTFQPYLKLFLCSHSLLLFCSRANVKRFVIPNHPVPVFH